MNLDCREIRGLNINSVDRPLTLSSASSFKLLKIPNSSQLLLSVLYDLCILLRSYELDTSILKSLLSNCRNCYDVTAALCFYFYYVSLCAEACMNYNRNTIAIIRAITSALSKMKVQLLV